MKKNNQAPNIISGKDLDYLSDMFEWNYGAFKNTAQSFNEVNNETIKDMINKSLKLFNNNMKQVIDILGGKNE